ncbi:ImmA/IrrE family metallo-endopeptidase [Tomitella fengzijianii]|uniref:ImmA/IrrE family metallo-endopeptidase n=1 Tax=Tomitella fengzijianii TaxID=2597660 RepID=UPI00131BDE62|nr:ImmA/IrrE family metallo-endopeptidase [Tomitella fengzijianii]
MVVRVDVAPALLEWAVERAGWDDDTIDARAPRFRSWVRGDARPTLKQLERFANATHAPLGMLFLPAPPHEEVPIPDMRTLGNAAVRRPSSDLLDTIYQCQERQDWFRDFATESGLEAPDFVGSATTTTIVTEVDARMRRTLAFEVADRAGLHGPGAAMRRLIDAVEDAGVLVMVNGIVGGNTTRTLNPEEFRGFTLADPLVPLIFVNGADAKVAQIFTLIHEFAHVWLGGSALSDATLAVHDGVPDEVWCNKVAAEVLVPRDELRAQAAGALPDGELERLSRHFMVSPLVVLISAFDAGLLGWEEYRRRFDAQRDSSRAAQRRSSSGGNYYKTQPLRLSRRFTRAVTSSAFEGTTSFRDAYRLLGTRNHNTFVRLAEEVHAA